MLCRLWWFHEARGVPWLGFRRLELSCRRNTCAPTGGELRLARQLTESAFR
jgi:hypothetical protein